ncbi:iron-containing alcohol dehydrogenase [symbiont of Argiope bruennichi]|uniref:iron-containing alcohol dehydrogenase n=1 Tax=symbiont of Argiope bruennichi TaxID=2810479 RepID=UPI003DA3FEE4
MKNFVYFYNTKLYFGQNSIENILDELKNHQVKRILFCYGRESIKKNGIYDEVIKILKTSSCKFWELSGIKPNPTLDSLNLGIKLVKQNNIDFILAVGGGSVIDLAKAVAACSQSKSAPWELFCKNEYDYQPLPVGAVLTLAATGSENNGNAVVTNEQEQSKRSINDPRIVPKFAILDPSYTLSVNRWHTVCGSIDIISHCLEQYFSTEKNTDLIDNLTLAIIKTVIDNTKIVLSKPKDLNARSEILLASSFALNGLLSCSKFNTTGWETHTLGHPVSAMYDATHGATLAVIFPRIIKHLKNVMWMEKYQKLGKLLNIEVNSLKDVDLLADKLLELFVSWGSFSKLRDFGVKEYDIDIMSMKAFDRKNLDYKYDKIGFVKPLDFEEIKKIYQECY